VTLAEPTECLFCGVTLTDETATRAHVFPRWLQDRCGIANLELDLANETPVRYAQLLAPACRDCNNVHAGQLEARVSDGTASPQDMWLWMLKIQMGTFYWESGKPKSRDRRSSDNAQPIFPLDVIDITYFQTLFTALRDGATFDPTPSGTLLRFPDPQNAFDYADRLFSHPQARDNMYSAGLIAFDGHVWIALFDDGRRVVDGFIDVSVMEKQVAGGRDPRDFLPELIYTRSRILWDPKLMIGRAPNHTITSLTALPTMGRPHIFDFDPAELATFHPPPASAS